MAMKRFFHKPKEKKYSPNLELWHPAGPGYVPSERDIIETMIKVLNYKELQNTELIRKHRKRDIKRAEALRTCLKTLKAIEDKAGEKAKPTHKIPERKLLQTEIAHLLSQQLSDECSAKVSNKHEFGKIYRMCVEMMPEAFITFLQQDQRTELIFQGIENGAFFREINPAIITMVTQNPAYREAQLFQIQQHITNAIQQVEQVPESKANDIHLVTLELLHLANAFINTLKAHEPFNMEWYQMICEQIQNPEYNLLKYQGDPIIEAAKTSLTYFMRYGILLLPTKAPLAVEEKSDSEAAQEVKWTPASEDKPSDPGYIILKLTELHKHKEVQNKKLLRRNKEIELERNALLHKMLSDITKDYEHKSYDRAALIPYIAGIMTSNLHRRCHHNLIKNYKKKGTKAYTLNEKDKLGTLHRMCIELLPEAYIAMLWNSLISDYAQHAILFQNGIIEHLEKNLSAETTNLLSKNSDYQAFKTLLNLFQDTGITKPEDTIKNRESIAELQQKMAHQKTTNSASQPADIAESHNTLLDTANTLLEQIKSQKLEKIDNNALQSFIAIAAAQEENPQLNKNTINLLHAAATYCKAIVMLNERMAKPGAHLRYGDLG